MKLGLLVTWMVAMGIALAFALRPQALNLGIEGADKILHMLAFMVLTIIPIIAFNKIRNIVLTVLSILAVGIVIEYVQIYIPARHPDMMDAIFNIMGAGIGAMIGLSLRSTYRAGMQSKT